MRQFINHHRVKTDRDLAMKYYELAVTKGSAKAIKRLTQIKESNK